MRDTSPQQDCLSGRWIAHGRGMRPQRSLSLRSSAQSNHPATAHPPARKTMNRMTAEYGITDEYWLPRDRGDLPKGCNAGALRKLARTECQEHSGGKCERRGRQKCLIFKGRRCRWFEVSVLEDREFADLAAEFEAALGGTLVSSGGVSYEQRVRMALEDLLEQQREVSVADVVRYAQIPAQAARRHIPAQARALGLGRVKRGRITAYKRV